MIVDNAPDVLTIERFRGTTDIGLGNSFFNQKSDSNITFPLPIPLVSNDVTGGIITHRPKISMGVFETKFNTTTNSNTNATVSIVEAAQNTVSFEIHFIPTQQDIIFLMNTFLANFNGVQESPSNHWITFIGKYGSFIRYYFKEINVDYIDGSQVTVVNVTLSRRPPNANEQLNVDKKDVVNLGGS